MGFPTGRPPNGWIGVIKCDPVLPEARKNLPALGNRPAVVIREIAPGSLAEKAGLKKTDIIVTINGHGTWETGSIQRDLESRSGTLPIVIIRDNKETTLDLQLAE